MRAMDFNCTGIIIRSAKLNTVIGKGCPQTIPQSLVFENMSDVTDVKYYLKDWNVPNG